MDSNKIEREYAKPEIVDHGTLAELTAQQSAGHLTDKAFPAGTPSSVLTFSTPVA